MKNSILLVLLFTCSLLSGQTAYKHISTAANTGGHITTLDHPLLNGQPSALIQVTPEYKVVYNAHTVGVWYNGSRWTVFNQNLQTMPISIQFNVLIETPSSNAFVHTAVATNTGGHITTLDNPQLNGNPNALILVTQNYGVYNRNEVGVWYNGNRWTIYNENRQALPANAKFNVSIQTGRAIIHTATTIWGSANSATDVVYETPTDLLFVTHNYNPRSVYNVNPTGVYQTPGRPKWAILTGNTAAMPVNAGFNVLRFSGSGTPPPTGTRVMTRFDPTLHGFKFANTFANNRFYGPIDVSFGGRCAGMIYTALDYYHNNLPIPQQTDLPVEGSVLSTYISGRQEVANGAYIEKYQELNFNIAGSRTGTFFNWGIQGFGGGRLEELKTEVDAGRSCPITLYDPTGNLVEYPHHVVLAIGYEMGRYRGDLGDYKDDFKIYVYDPNYPQEIKVLRPYSADLRYGYTDGSEGKKWLTYFLHKKYRVATPPGQTIGCPSNRANISNQSFRGQNLSNRDYGCVLANGTDFYGCTINQGNFERGEMRNAVFYGANLRNSNFQYTNIERGNFHGADLKDTRFSFCEIITGSFYGADMKLAKLNTSILRNSNFEGADMQRVEMVGADCSGARFVRTDLKSSNCTNANFSGANLTGADFRNATISGANFTGAITTGIQLQGAIRTGTIGL